MFTYADCLNVKLRGGQKKLAGNTYLVELGDCFGVKLHNTFIVKLYADGRVEYNSGGWMTSTTKKRMNSYSPYYIQQKNNLWSVWLGNSYMPGSRFVGLFKNNMVVQKGKVINATK